MTFSELEYYDYVIIGGSDSGPVLAARLSEMENQKVFFLNSLEPLEEKEKIPFMYTMAQFRKNSPIYAEPKAGFGDGLTVTIICICLNSAIVEKTGYNATGHIYI